MRISILGLGYVGVVTSACIADSGHEVIAVDTDPAKIKCLAEGRTPIVEPGLSALIEKNVAAGRLKTSLSCHEAVSATDLTLVCVGTPGKADGALDLSHITAACTEIGAALKNKSGFHGVVLRSTVLPGTSRRVAIPAIEQASGKKAGEGFGFAYNPEFLREGAAIADYRNPAKVVIGKLDEKTAAMLEALYNGLPGPRAVTALETAEGVKYASNAWHALKVVFANEIGNIMKSHGVDGHEVMDVFCRDTRLNISSAYLKPGFAFGGSCLPKDIRALCVSARERGMPTPLLDSLPDINAAQVKRGFDMVMKTGRRKVALLGLAFKAGSDDLRESPLLALARMLADSGVELAIYDPSVSESLRSGGAKLLSDDLARRLVDAPAALEGAELFVIGNHGPDFAQILRSNDNTPVVDLVRLKDRGNEERAGYEGICW